MKRRIQAMDAAISSGYRASYHPTRVRSVASSRNLLSWLRRDHARRVKNSCHSARLDPLCTLYVIEHGEAARDDPRETLAAGRGLPVLAHRDEWYVLPYLHLQFRGDATLLGKIVSIELGLAQFLDAPAVGPAVISGLAVGPQRRIAERVDVRDRAID
jgi:hypothetical protein